MTNVTVYLGISLNKRLETICKKKKVSKYVFCKIAILNAVTDYETGVDKI